MYETLADLVASLHSLWIVLTLALAAWAFIGFFAKWRTAIFAIRAFLAIGFTTLASQLVWLGCPLTLLENTLRTRHDPSTAYEGAFLAHLIEKWVGVKVDPIFITAQLLLFLGVAVYLVLKIQPQTIQEATQEG